MSNKQEVQEIIYKDAEALESVLSCLRYKPALVERASITHLKHEIKLAEKGRNFILHIGECAESLKSSHNKNFVKTFADFINKNAKVLEDGLGLKVLKIGRFAGQFAKPRSNAFEADGLLSFRGELINSPERTPCKREPNPYRMLLAYSAAKKALEYLTAIKETEAERISSSVQRKPQQDPVYTSHEGLLLPYEKALTRKVESSLVNLGAHLLWLGKRTSYIGSPHVEYLSGLVNPIGIKVSPSLGVQETKSVLKALNRNNESGKILLILRFGNDELCALKHYLTMFKEEGIKGAILVDPMHGNTKHHNDYKVRYITDILHNISFTVKCLNKLGLRLHGLHLEAVPQDLTECIGSGVDELSVAKRYFTTCDPRLNAKQTADVIMHTLATLRK